MINHDQKIRTALEAVRKEFQLQIPVRFETIFILYKELENSGWRDKEARVLYRHSHNLTGSCKTFGIDDIAMHSQALSRQLRRLIDADSASDKVSVVEKYVKELEMSVKNATFICENI